MTNATTMTTVSSEINANDHKFWFHVRSVDSRGRAQFLLSWSPYSIQWVRNPEHSQAWSKWMLSDMRHWHPGQEIELIPLADQSGKRRCQPLNPEYVG